MTTAPAPVTDPAPAPTPAPDPAPAPNFDDVFAQLAKDESALTPVPPDPAPAPAVSDPAAPEPTNADPAAPVATDPPADPAAPAPAAGDPPPAPATPAPVSGDADVLARFADILAQKIPAQPAPAAPAAPEPAPELYTPEERELIATYQKDWPDVVRAEALIRRAEYRDVIGYVMNEFAKHMAPLMEQVAAVSSTTHLQQLSQQVPDYDDLRDRVVAWATSDEHPPYLRAAYQHVVQQGTAEEIRDLINRYRAATGTPAPAAAPAAAPVEPPPVVRQAAASLAPVPSKRTTAAPPAAPSTFEDAFAAFAKENAA